MTQGNRLGVAKRIAYPALFLFIYLYAFPYFPTLRSANELPRILQTEEMVDHRTFAIDRRMSEIGSTFDIATTPKGRHYPNKAPGLSVVAVPAYGLLRLLGTAPSQATVTWWLRALVVTCPCIWFLLVPFRRVSLKLTGGDERSVDAITIAYGLGSMAMPYGILFLSHQAAAISLGVAFWLALSWEESSRPHGRAAMVGLCTGASLAFDYQSIFGAALVGVYFLIRVRPGWRDVLAAIAGGLVPLGVLLFYQWICFGSPLLTGYSYAVDPEQKKGFLGIVGPSALSIWQAFVDPSNGLLILMPWTTLLVVPLVRLRTFRLETVLCAALVLVYLVFLISLAPEVGRAGWAVGPRYVDVMIPFAAWLACIGFSRLDRHLAGAAFLRGLVVFSVVVYVVISTTYPHWPTRFRNPLFEVGFRALREGTLPPSLGGALGLPGTWAMVPLYAVIAAFVGSRLFREQARRAAVVAVGALALAVIGLCILARAPRAPDAEGPWRYVRGTITAR